MNELISSFGGGRGDIDETLKEGPESGPFPRRQWNIV
jgi:hypothetical protein